MSLVKVTFEWDDTFGPCYDCGRPAAYEVREPRLRYCSVCAAQQAADGEQITWLFADQYAEVLNTSLFDAIEGALTREGFESRGHTGKPDEMCWCGVVHFREDDDRSAW